VAEDFADKASELDKAAGGLYRQLPPHLQALIDLLPLNQPVHRSEIEASYPRSNYARRIRKIVAEYGWEIDRYRGKEGANDDWYVRRSKGPVRSQRIRHEVTPPTRHRVYERDQWRCQLCGTAVDQNQNETSPQCDHKIPADRDGGSQIENLQTLCTRCNLKKRQACRACRLSTCQGCPFAYPEQFDTIFVLKLSNTATATLRDAVAREGVPPDAIISRLIEGSASTDSP
jgi:5-methylcytosine-specific restriction endonuclease McrA